MKNPKVKQLEEIVPVFNYDILETTKLSKTITPLPSRFDKVIENRKSVRNFNKLTLQQLSDILWYVAKVKKTFLQENEYILTHRGTPSAGARHPIDILIYNPTLLTQANFYYYNAFEHSINKLANSHGNIINFISDINKIVDTSNATIIWFVAHKQRTTAKYSNADSLIWRDVGALINGIQLVCTAMDLNSCPIGILGEPFISNFFNNQIDVSGAGGILIG
jgi:SagB-type dehydrogenase family enzyme